MLLSIPVSLLNVEGYYVARAGVVGSGGMERTLSLKGGRFQYMARGCFMNESYAGRYRQRGDMIDLDVEEPTNLPRPWRRYRLRLVKGAFYLFAPNERSNDPGPLTLQRQAGVPRSVA